MAHRQQGFDGSVNLQESGGVAAVRAFRHRNGTSPARKPQK